MNLRDWIESHPAIPQKPRGESHHISLYISRDEAEALSRVLQDHRLFGIHNGSRQDLIRHALYFYLVPLLELLDEGYRPLSEQLRAEITNTGIGKSIDEIRTYYGTQARELQLLLDVGEFDKMFEHYERVIQFVRSRDGVWAGLLMRMLREHGEMASWREAVRRMGAVEEQRMRLIEEGL